MPKGKHMDDLKKELKEEVRRIVIRNLKSSATASNPSSQSDKVEAAEQAPQPASNMTTIDHQQQQQQQQQQQSKPATKNESPSVTVPDATATKYIPYSLNIDSGHIQAFERSSAADHLPNNPVTLRNNNQLLTALAQDLWSKLEKKYHRKMKESEDKRRRTMLQRVSEVETRYKYALADKEKELRDEYLDKLAELDMKEQEFMSEVTKQKLMNEQSTGMKKAELLDQVRELEQRRDQLEQLEHEFTRHMNTERNQIRLDRDKLLAKEAELSRQEALIQSQINAAVSQHKAEEEQKLTARVVEYQEQERSLEKENGALKDAVRELRGYRTAAENRARRLHDLEMTLQSVQSELEIEKETVDDLKARLRKVSDYDALKKEAYKLKWKLEQKVNNSGSLERQKMYESEIKLLKQQLAEVKVEKEKRDEEFSKRIFDDGKRYEELLRQFGAQTSQMSEMSRELGKLRLRLHHDGSSSTAKSHLFPQNEKKKAMATRFELSTTTTTSNTDLSEPPQTPPYLKDARAILQKLDKESQALNQSLHTYQKMSEAKMNAGVMLMAESVRNPSVSRHQVSPQHFVLPPANSTVKFASSDRLNQPQPQPPLSPVSISDSEPEFAAPPPNVVVVQQSSPKKKVVDEQQRRNLHSTTKFAQLSSAQTPTKKAGRHPEEEFKPRKIFAAPETPLSFSNNAKNEQAGSSERSPRTPTFEPVPKISVEKNQSPRKSPRKVSSKSDGSPRSTAGPQLQSKQDFVTEAEARPLRQSQKSDAAKNDETKTEAKSIKSKSRPDDFSSQQPKQTDVQQEETWEAKILKKEAERRQRNERNRKSAVDAPLSSAVRHVDVPKPKPSDNSPAERTIDPKTTESNPHPTDAKEKIKFEEPEIDPEMQKYMALVMAQRTNASSSSDQPKSNSSPITSKSAENSQPLSKQQPSSKSPIEFEVEDPKIEKFETYSDNEDAW